jgi:hypothetical protein
MLQRYDIARNDQTDCLSIKEYAVLETKSFKRHDYTHTREDYSLIHEISYDGDMIRAAIEEGQKALISELRSGDFFPIHPCVELIADSVAAIFNGSSASTTEVSFDDRTVLSTYSEE